MLLKGRKQEFLLVMLGSLFSVTNAGFAVNQLDKYKNGTKGPIGMITTSNGAHVNVDDMSVLNSPLIFNEHFMDSITHFVRERIPERVVHTKGAGAFGYFEVTHNVTDICKAKFLTDIGKSTSVAVRFSITTSDKGDADTLPYSRGFSIKFYTDDGNFDIVGFNTPMFPIKDPSVFPSMIRSIKRNPATNLLDHNMKWDFNTLRPESMFFFLYLLAGYATPKSYRHMPGFSIHTYQIYNEEGESYLARFHIIPDQGVENMLAEDAAAIWAKDPDYYGRDLYEAIERGDYPSWTVSLQVLTAEDVKLAPFDVFDVTKILPLGKYPLRPIGKIVLNRNPRNYFAEVEQLAFGPYNLVAGILGSPDKMFEARRLAYRDAQLYRLGANFYNVPVNCPLAKSLSYNRDGAPPVGLNGEDTPNYYPNSFNGPIPSSSDKKAPKLISVTQDQSYNFDQAAEMYKQLFTTEELKDRLIKNCINLLGMSDKFIQEKVIKVFNEINKELGDRLTAALDVY